MRYDEFRKYFDDVYAVSEMRQDGEKNKHQLEINFHARRGVKQICDHIKVHGKDSDVYLDYFWLANNYYRNMYGLKWIKEKAPMLLKAGAARVILPVNSEMKEMLSKNADTSEYNYDLMYQTELVDSDIAIRERIEELGQVTLKGHLERLEASGRFVVITKRTTS